jgi:spore coat polysaccharide biosynthesis predicted glycosyltransferase SpsG
MVHLVIRADGGPEIGYGHLVRTGALAELALERGHSITCVTTTPKAAHSVYSENTSILSLQPENERDEFLEWISTERPDAVLTDSYAIGTPYQRSLRNVSSRLGVVLDDTRHTVCADILINGNVYAPTLEYEYQGNEPDWCLGLDYLLLREKIRTLAQESPPKRHPQKKVLRGCRNPGSKR